MQEAELLAGTKEAVEGGGREELRGLLGDRLLDLGLEDLDRVAKPLGREAASRPRPRPSRVSQGRADADNARPCLPCTLHVAGHTQLKRGGGCAARGGGIDAHMCFRLRSMSAESHVSPVSPSLACGATESPPLVDEERL